MALQKARRTGEFQEYRAARKSYKDLIIERKRGSQQLIMDQLAQIDNIGDAWKFIKAISCQELAHPVQPNEAELTEHFGTLLEGGSHRLQEGHQGQVFTHIEIDDEEFARHIDTLKRGKTAGTDEIKAESIIFADCQTKAKIKGILNCCIQGNSIPEEWREVKIFPLLKKGDPSLAQNYRGISLVNCAYKLYANILADRLSEFVESNDILPDGQNGFRKKRSTIDNIYILNTCIQTAISKGESLYAGFVDYTAAFDKINRHKLFEKLKKLKVPEYLVQAIQEIYKETPYTIGSSTIWTNKGLRQGCPMSPLLFAIYIYDIEKALDNWQSGGIRIGQSTIRCLEYADDIIIMARQPGELKDMIQCLKRYSDKRDMVISTEKTKVVRFSAGGRKSTHKWPCGDTFLEEVNSFNYLGFVFQSNGSYKKHLSAMATRGKTQVSKVWSIGERQFPENFKIRKAMYRPLVESCITYGSEIFGYEERPELERIQRKYWRWTLGVAPWTKVKALMRETMSTPIHFRTASRALNYELKASNSPCQALRECVKYNRTEVTPTASAKRLYLARLGFSEGVLEEMRARGVDTLGILRRRQEDQWVQTMSLEGEVSPFSLPGYLRRGKDYKMIARFRLGNETRGDQNWRRDRSCRVCDLHEETTRHLLECSGQDPNVVLLHENGRGREAMRRILDWRRAYEEENIVKN